MQSELTHAHREITRGRKVNLQQLKRLNRSLSATGL